MTVMFQKADVVDEIAVALAQPGGDRVRAQPVRGAAHQAQRFDETTRDDLFARLAGRKAGPLARVRRLRRSRKPWNEDAGERQAGALHCGKLVANG